MWATMRAWRSIPFPVAWFAAVALLGCGESSRPVLNDTQHPAGGDADVAPVPDAQADASEPDASLIAVDAGSDADQDGVYDEHAAGSSSDLESDAGPYQHEVKDTCARIAALYEDAIRAAQICMFPPRTASVCTTKLVAKLGCPCETFVNEERAEELAQAEALAEEWQALGCRVERECTACSPAGFGFCRLPTADELPATGIPMEGVPSYCTS